MAGVRVYELGFILVVSLCCSFLFAGAKVVTDPSEVSTLQVIKSNFIDARNLLNSWNTGDPCTSSWRGVSCYNFTGDDGYLHVHELLLLNMNLSGSLAPEIGHLSQLKILDVMWNKISGNIPKEIGNIKSLELLLLSGNQLSGSLPEEIGYLPKLIRLQIDENYISGPLPKSFANLNNIMHLHMNNNSISGKIPPELSKLSTLLHILLDNNNLSGSLPQELSSMPSLTILQLDNNPFRGSAIPDSYGNMSRLLKLSLRNCSLQGSIPDLSRAPHLLYLDLSWNQLTGFIPSNKLADNITTIDLSNNNLSGTIPANFSGLPFVQRLALENNSLSGPVPSTIWLNMTYNATSRLTLDFENNLLSITTGVLNPPANVTIRLRGNPVCVNASHLNIVQFCEPQTGGNDTRSSSGNSTIVCLPQTCPTDIFYEYVPKSPVPCFCAAPIRVGYRLKSPSFSYFPPYIDSFEKFLSSDLNLYPDQLFIDSYIWEEGPRLRMYLKFFPHYTPHTSKFNLSEIVRIEGMFSRWKIPLNDFYGPYELLNFTLIGPYENVILDSTKSGISKGALVGIVLAAVVFAVSVSSFIAVFVTRRHSRYYHTVSRKRQLSQIPMKIDGVKGFTFRELARAANNFSNSTQVGQGGYGKVYKGILSDGTIVAIKRAQEGSLQGQKEFLTEIELLSRLHHRNLVSLNGYCDEEGEQMLVYEFMPNGTLRDHLSGKLREPLSFSMRLHIALGSAKGILYLHTEADPPIFHRDIKASNILLDLKLTAKVADFGLSRLAPVPGIEGDVPGYVSTVVRGTPGYLDPEYFLTHNLTDKSDVYSLGVVFLELLTSMQPISHGKNIVREVNAASESGMLFSVIDKQMGSYPSKCVKKFMTLALRCCQDDPNMRPSMSEVVGELESIKRMMPESEAPPSGSMTIDSKTVSMLLSSTSLSASSISGSNLLSSTMPTVTPR